ncbi:zinc finger protein 84-like [Perca fluviatilis]|uniref:zinc finger protein 84-like n=1 Tax=Perca fluviatilis TaxID=8168 RepID=UPI0019659CBB|nr:zinc finger protein 84-like [Perca fluviatilis]
MRTHTGQKPFRCFECGRKFDRKGSLNRHMRTHTGEKPFSCSVCNKSFTHSANLRSHMTVHTGEKRFSCVVCDKKFQWLNQVKRHKCVGRKSSQRHQSQTEENREAEPPARRETQHMETEADVEDCGGPEPARNSHPLLQPETEDQTGDSSDPETDDRADWKETREPQSASNSLRKDSSFTISISDRPLQSAGFTPPFLCTLLQPILASSALQSQCLSLGSSASAPPCSPEYPASQPPLFP